MSPRGGDGRAALFDLPYFDILLREIDARNELVLRALARHVHVGYWEEPAPAAPTWEEFAMAGERLTAEVVAEAAIEAGHRVLDVGCGFGGTIAYLDERHVGVWVAGLNIDARQIERAARTVLPARRPGNGLAFLVGDGCALPFADETFDLVLAVECVAHFGSRRSFLGEAHRVLRPGGRLVLSEATVSGRGAPFVALLYPFYRGSSRRTYGRRNHTATLRQYRALARATGLDVKTVRDVTANTAPTFRALAPLYETIGPGGRDFARANAFRGIISRRGWYRHYIVVAEKPRHGAGARPR